MNKNSSFSVPDVMDVLQVGLTLSKFRNWTRPGDKSAVTSRIHLQSWRTCTKIMYIETSSINFERIRQRCLLFISEIQGLVICWPKFGLTKKKIKSQVGITGLPFSISIVLTNRRINNGQ